jgi:uncharacterized protein YprB with RNaseH-like and TPR domain
MLQSTFQHTPGIGPKIEQRLWASGVLDWTSAGERPPACLSSAQTNALARCLDLSARALEDGNPRFFTGLLPAGLHWRLFPEFRGSAVYLDIETTGMDAWGAEITTIALYDGRTIQTFVQGRNLADFPDAVDAYDLIVTYNGKCFDVPFIENYFHIRLDHAHIDLRYVLKRLGYAGGLKRCEKAMGIDRGHLDGVDGFFAVLLWQAYREEEDPRVLETLLAYNVEDVVNLEALMVDAYNQNIMGTPYASTHRIPTPQAPEIPFRADARIIEAVRRRIFP